MEPAKILLLAGGSLIIRKCRQQLAFLTMIRCPSARFLGHIKEQDWSDTHVFDAEGDLPSFLYSTGFWSPIAREMIDVLGLTVRPQEASAA